jgi:two-component system chemotaxis response regulator CheB
VDTQKIFPVPIIIVQHMPPFFTKLLAERLSSKSNIEVFEDSPGVKLEPGKAWIAPGDFHMVLSRKGTDIFLETNQEPPENSCRPAVDVLFRSVVKLYRGGVEPWGSFSREWDRTD